MTLYCRNSLYNVTSLQCFVNYMANNISDHYTTDIQYYEFMLCFALIMDTDVTITI